MTTPRELAERVCHEVAGEYQSARLKFDPFHSGHEGYAVLKEEVDEMWDAIKENRLDDAKAKAVQVAAMAVAFCLEVSK